MRVHQPWHRDVVSTINNRISVGRVESVRRTGIYDSFILDCQCSVFDYTESRPVHRQKPCVDYCQTDHIDLIPRIHWYSSEQYVLRIIFARLIYWRTDMYFISNSE